MIDVVARDIHTDEPIYGYVPTEWICALFLVLFALSGVIHFYQAIRFRLWWLFPTAVACSLTEVLGWSARLWSSKNPTLLTPFLMQISTLGLAPTFFVAANFIILGQIIIRLGRQYSRIAPKLYTIIFCSADMVALAVQGAGGGMASAAVGDGPEADKGSRIMLAGIAFQLAAIAVYVALASEFFARWALDKPVRTLGDDEMKAAEAGFLKASHKKTLAAPIDHMSPRSEDTAVDVYNNTNAGLNRRAKFMIGALAFSTLCVFIRSVYRVIELSEGWGGPILTTERYFHVLDGAMITLAMYCLNVFHPGWLLK